MGGMTKSTKQTSISQPFVNYLPGQEAYLPEFISGLKPIYEKGDFSSPIGKMLYQMTSEEAKKEEAAQTKKIASSKMAAPSKAKALTQVATGAVEAAAGVPAKIWTGVAETIEKYALASPQFGIGSFSRGGGGGGWSACCFIFCAGMNDENLTYVKRYKDTFYDVDSTAARGYKLLSTILVPLMFKHPMVKSTIRVIMIKPMMGYAEAYYEGKGVKRRFLYPIAKFWSGVFRLFGWVGKQVTWTEYMQLHSYWRS